jgi:hypothetical protein
MTIEGTDIQEVHALLVETMICEEGCSRFWISIARDEIASIPHVFSNDTNASYRRHSACHLAGKIVVDVRERIVRYLGMLW